MGVQGSRGPVLFLYHLFCTSSHLPWLSVLRPGLGLTSLWSSLAWYTIGSWHSCADGFSPSGTQKGFFIPRRGCSAGSAPRHSQLILETPGPEELGRRPLEPLVVRRRGVLCCGVWKAPGASLLLSSAGLRASQAVTLPRPAEPQRGWRAGLPAPSSGDEGQVGRAVGRLLCAPPRAPVRG